MARLLARARNAFLIGLSSSETQSRSFRKASGFSLLSRKALSTSSEVSDETSPASPIEANIIRILRNEINYQADYAPPHEHATEYKSFVVQDRPAEQFIRMTRKFGDSEDIKIEATMFDGCTLIPKLEDDSVGEDLRLHISVVVDISKADGSEVLELVCSAWPDSFEVQNVYLLQRNRKLARPFTGPDIRSLDLDLQKSLREYLKAREIDEELSVFLHDYMMNKDRVELIQWLRRVSSYVQRRD